MFDFFDVIGITSIVDSIKERFMPSDKQEFYLKDMKPKKFIYRPKNLSEYIGQENAKALTQLTLDKIRTIKPCHILLSGHAGHGKTTLAYIIAYQLNFELHYYIGGAFTWDNLKDFLYSNEKGDRPHILFIDEIHNLDKKIAEFMYPLIEDFILATNNAQVRPFIFIGATTEKSTLLKKFTPLVDRMGAQITLESYTANDIKEILAQYNAQIYQEQISNEVYETIANNCRFTPRISLALFDDYIVCKDIKRVLNSRRIVRDSLTDTDIAILLHLKEVGKPVGEEALAIIGNVDRADYKRIVEPFLLGNHYLSRTARGRILTAKGQTMLGEINDNKM
jgi:Holliday junction DNA helicase RuvB